MTAAQEIEQLKAQNQTLREQLASRDALITQLVERVQALEAQLAQDSHNSSKPPSSDEFVRSPKKRSLRKVSGKKPGGQPDHEGHSLHQVAQPDHFTNHFAPTCQGCKVDLAQVAASAEYEARQVFELPVALRLEVTEHRAYTTVCPHCQHRSKAAFPSHVTNWVQYGPGFRALGVYLVQYQLLPYARACELLNQIYSETLSPGTLAGLVAQCYEHLAPSEEQIKAQLSQSQVLHCDETGLYVEGKRHWLHVASTPTLTHYAYHAKRGAQATAEIGILPSFSGTAIHDGYAPYQGYECEHGLCNAHHLRELTFVHEQLGQGWASEFKTLLLDLKGEVETATARGEVALSAERLVHYEATYQHLLEQGLAANPPPPGGWPRGKRGRAKQSKAKNLLDRLGRQRRQVLLFAYRFAVPFDNNQAERDIRMVKVQQKTSGCFRSQAGATYFCRIRGYLSTMQKQGHNLFFALLKAFVAQPLLPHPLV